MFIIKLGAEALNRLGEQLSVDGVHSTKSKNNVVANGLYSSESKLESSILYNLLSCEEGSLSKTQSHLFPSYLNSNVGDTLPPRANTTSCSNQIYNEPFSMSPRPYSAPEVSSLCTRKNRKRIYSLKSPAYSDLKSINFNKTCKISSKLSDTGTADSPTMSCSTDSLGEEPMDLSRTGEVNVGIVDDGRFIVDSWLYRVVVLISSNEQCSNSLGDLPPNIRLHLLRSSWHRIVVTYLFEHLSSLSGGFPTQLWRFVHSVTGLSGQSALGKKNMACMYKNLVDDLSVILCQIRKMDLTAESMGFLRIGLLLTGNQDEDNQKNLKLIEQFIESKIGSSQSNVDNIGDLLDNLLRLNSVVVETIFYGHLKDSVENVIEQVFTDS